MVVVENDERGSQIGIDEVGTAGEPVVDRASERVLRVRDPRDVPHRDTGPVDTFEGIIE